MQSLDRIKCRLLEGTNAQDVRALVLDMQARLLLDMLGKGIESALINPGSLLSEPWQASGETLSSLDSESMTIEPALVSSIQVWFAIYIGILKFTILIVLVFLGVCCLLFIAASIVLMSGTFVF